MREPYTIHLTLRLRPLAAILGVLALALMLITPSAGYTQSNTNTQYFPETGHTVSGRFLEYWQQNGGLAQQGYPLTQPFMEKSALDGKTYMVQYFERAVFELHPENKAPYDVLLSQLGKFQLDSLYPNNSNSAAGTGIKVADPPGKVFFIVYMDCGQDRQPACTAPVSLGSNKATKGKFLEVVAEMYDPTPTASNIDADAIKLQDSNGNTYDLASDDVQQAAAQATGDHIYKDIVPGKSAQTEVFVFDVPPDVSRDFQLVVGD